MLNFFILVQRQSLGPDQDPNCRILFRIRIATNADSKNTACGLYAVV
jgi:hypothetical protein